jgi:hypothetical protein
MNKFFYYDIMEVLRKHDMALTSFNYFKELKYYKFEAERIKQDETDSGRGEVQDLSGQREEGDSC